MLNKDINSRFEDWLISPKETLDFEVKRWLDWSDPESPGIVAKALIALENHGGGFLLFGYMEDAGKNLVPDPGRPADLSPYLSDAINSIVRRRAEPVFPVEVTLQTHPESSEQYPLVRIDGRSKVPVRSASATPGGSLKNNTYYVRGAGPESRSPESGAEWDALIRRVVLNQRDEIVSVLRSFQGVGQDSAGFVVQSEEASLLAFKQASLTLWKGLNEGLPATHPARITQGHYIFSARIVGSPKEVGEREILASIERAHRYTGWPMFVALHQPETKPALVEGALQAWLAKTKAPDVGHADFWRIRADGYFFSLRGYQEDAMNDVVPGTLFEATLPMWRLGEFLLRVTELGAVMFDGEFDVVVECEWNGLNGRSLYNQSDRWFVHGQMSASADSVASSGRFTRAAIHDLLPDVVKALTLGLYKHFDLFEPSNAMYADELGRMAGRRF